MLLHIRYNIINFFATVFYGNPSKDMFVVAVTGSKDTEITAELTRFFFQLSIGKTLVIGQKSYTLDASPVNALGYNTNPFKLFGLLAQAKSQNYGVVVIVFDVEAIHKQIHTSLLIDLTILTKIQNEFPRDIDQGLERSSQLFKEVFLSMIANEKPNKLGVFAKDDSTTSVRQHDLGLDIAINYGIVSSATVQATIRDTGSYDSHISLVYLGQEHMTKVPYTKSGDIYGVIAALCSQVLIGIGRNDLVAICPSLPNPTQDSFTSNIYQEKTYYFCPLDLRENLIPMREGWKKTMQAGKKIFVILSSATDQHIPINKAIIGRMHDLIDFVVITHFSHQPYSDLEHITMLHDHMGGHIEGENYYVLPERKYAIAYAETIAKPGDYIILFTHKESEHYDKIQCSHISQKNQEIINNA